MKLYTMCVVTYPQFSIMQYWATSKLNCMLGALASVSQVFKISLLPVNGYNLN